MLRRVLTVSLTSLAVVAAAAGLSPAWPGASASPDSPYIQVDASGGKKKASRAKSGRKKPARKSSGSGKAARRGGSSSAHMINVERQGSPGQSR